MAIEPALRKPGAGSRRLAHKYAFALIGAVAAVTAVLGAFGGWFTYREALRQLGRTQIAQASEAASVIHTSLEAVRRQAAAVAALPWEAPDWLSADDRRDEYRRLLRLSPVVEAVIYRDAKGREVLRVGRGLPAQDAAWPAQPESIAQSVSVTYAAGYEPVLSARLEAPEAKGSTVLVIGLRALAQELGSALEAVDSTVYVVDETGTVLLSRTAGPMLERLRLNDHARTGDAQLLHGVAEAARSAGGQAVIASSVPVPGLPWRVVVEQERAIALRPVHDALGHVAGVAAACLAASAAMAIYLARRLSRPIVELDFVAARLAAGDLSARADGRAENEIGSLSRQFNAMADSLQTTIEEQERRIAEKTLALETANRHKSQFISNMSHELRTPLVTVVGMSGSMLEDLSKGSQSQLSPAQRELYLKYILEAGNHLTAMISNILDMSKIESGLMTIDVDTYSVILIVRRAVSMVTERAMSAGLRIEVECADDLLWPVDRQLLTQVLINLLSNALKFTASGGTVRVMVQVEPRPNTTCAQAQTLILKVEDTGCGIAANDLPHLFEPYRQFGEARRRHGEGTGLGLSLVRRFVELHKGTVAVQSDVGRGTCVTVRLPDPTLPEAALLADPLHGEAV